MVDVRVKICGLRTPAEIGDAVSVGADYVGMVHCPGSPRHLHVSQMNDLTRLARPRSAVAVLVDPDDQVTDALAQTGQWTAFQLHGAEPPQRLARLATRYPGIGMWKALPVTDVEDLAAWRPYGQCAQRILFDARAPEGADTPGGHGDAFDWSILGRADLPADWMLAGGLDADNVAVAVRTTAARAVDVSSGVEVRPGVKSRDRMRAFLDALEHIAPRELRP